MSLIKNTLVFLDTGFFRNCSSDFQKELFVYAADGDIVVGTSWICLEEWRTQKINQLKGFLETQGETNPSEIKPQEWQHHVGCNSLAAWINKQRLTVPLDDKTLEEVSVRFIEDFIKEDLLENNVQVLYPEKYTKAVFDAYFGGGWPFQYSEKEPNKKDLPDAWVCFSARSLIEEDKNRHLENRYFIASDGHPKKQMQMHPFCFLPIDSDEDRVEQKKLVGISSLLINLKKAKNALHLFSETFSAFDLNSRG